MSADAESSKPRRFRVCGRFPEMLKFDDGVTDSIAGTQLAQLSSDDFLPHSLDFG